MSMPDAELVNQGQCADQTLSPGERLLFAVLGARAADLAQTTGLIEPLRDGCEGGAQLTRTAFAAALNLVLFEDLLVRVPTGAAFVADQRARGMRVVLDHGALRTIRFGDHACGALPDGQRAFCRILQPLGYELAGTYPLPRLKMTGHAWAHTELPATIPQFFVSELHVGAFDDDFQEVARRVFGNNRDPLDPQTHAVLHAFSDNGCAPLVDAIAALPKIAAAFGRQHSEPDVSDYALLLRHSAEAAWIATEGNAFNHATSRVAEIEAEADRQRSRGLPIKDRVEVSSSGRVRQTAFQADRVLRCFRQNDVMVEREVPGSFYEIIEREIDPATGLVDLSFDSRNATGIFTMTRPS